MTTALLLGALLLALAAGAYVGASREERRIRRWLVLNANALQATGDRRAGLVVYDLALGIAVPCQHGLVAGRCGLCLMERETA